MQEQVEAHAGLNGSGAKHGMVPVLDAETLAMPAMVAAGDVPPLRPTRSKRLAAIMADPVEREALRASISESDASISSIAERYGVHKETLRRRVEAEGWPRPPTAPKAQRPRNGSQAGMRRLANSMADAGMVQARILRAVDRQIGKVDGRMRKNGAEVEERDSRILGNLAKTLGALMQIGEGGTTSREVERPNRAEVEARLAERIRRWARGEEGTG